jgi:hypothetical protein
VRLFSLIRIGRLAVDPSLDVDVVKCSVEHSPIAAVVAKQPTENNKLTLSKEVWEVYRMEILKFSL